MSERKTHFSRPQEIRRPLLHSPTPSPPSLGAQAQCLPRGAGGEQVSSQPGGVPVWAPAPVWPGRGEGGVYSQVEQPVR